MVKLSSLAFSGLASTLLPLRVLSRARTGSGFPVHGAALLGSILPSPLAATRMGLPP